MEISNSSFRGGPAGSGTRKIRVALAPFLASCPAVVTLGVRANIDDYSPREKQLLLESDMVFFPTPRYAWLFEALSKPAFPSPWAYRLLHSRVQQQLLFQYLELPHPRSRVFFGETQKRSIPEHFSFPLILMELPPLPRMVHTVGTPEELADLSRHHNPVIVREWMEWDEVIRVLCVLQTPIGIQRRTAAACGDVSWEPIRLEHPTMTEPLSLTRHFLHRAHPDDVVLELGRSGVAWYFVQLSRPPVRWKTTDGELDRHRVIRSFIESDRI